MWYQSPGFYIYIYIYIYTFLLCSTKKTIEKKLQKETSNDAHLLNPWLCS